MAVVVHGAVLVGIEGVCVRVEVDLLRRLPCVVIVGLPSASVREAAERVRSAILAAGLEFPRSRVLISLGPADLRKEGTGFDLPVAVGILAAAGLVDREFAARWLLAGELSLSGELRPVRGALSMAWAARDGGFAGVIVPAGNGDEAALVDGVEVRVASSLAEVVAFLNGTASLPEVTAEPFAPPSGALDLRDVAGQPLARVAMEIAAAGGHNLLLQGPPGCGKTMLAARLPGVLPQLSRREALECTRVHSAAGLRSAHDGVVATRPFRAPHHSVSAAAMVGGSDLRPGEVSLAHNGVLFLDEFPEFRRDVREALRSPLEDRQVVLVRSAGRVVLPASVSLVAAANACPCGNLGHPRRPCTCSPPARTRYKDRLSGPILDRFDMRLALNPVDSAVLGEAADGEPSRAVRERVERARNRQYLRNGPGRTNAELAGEAVVAVADPTEAALRCLVNHVESVGASARGARRILRVARTVADLDGALRVDDVHLVRALDLRLDAAIEEVP